MLLATHALNLAARPNVLLIRWPSLPLSGDGVPLYIMQRVLIASTQVEPPVLGTPGGTVGPVTSWDFWLLALFHF